MIEGLFDMVTTLTLAMHMISLGQEHNNQTLDIPLTILPYFQIMASSQRGFASSDTV
jgi:hypothetical protein